MINARRATVDDADELVRLRGVLFGVGDDSDEHGWRDPARRILLRRLAEPEPTMAGFVVDQPGHEGRLAACAVGILEERLGGPRNPQGRVGYMFNVATDPEHRRQGHARACTSALIAWFHAQGAGLVDLRASDDGLSLYTSQGFILTKDPAMRLTLPSD
ncbi:GNAT family N-acetyltransferase [Actinoplanes sp. TRM 88003]|uniref:GNAT family N-acetyltransferase n=1 Tax=Paractinoplanes aksuensis TaxID=2939490 RepID=A0ABT1DFW9_9ACTN|nr:GNAT family N-acetyltransferase [Actinoplanes aksuensis]MCO8269731.1 GNAT family N-acetyltransferase [Actinoplanes aksuensis]